MLNFAGCNGCTIRVRKIAIINNSKQAMKKLSLNFLFMLGLMAALFFACGDDDEPDLAAPTVNDPAAVTVEAGDDATITFSVSAPAGYASSTVAVDPTSAGTATVTTPPTAGATSGSAVVTFTAGAAAATATVTLTVTDGEGDTDTGSASVTVNDPATGGDAPEISAAVLDTAADGNLTTLSDALEAIGLFDDLADADAITIFAPNNDAFADLLTAQSAADLTALVAALTEDGVADVLRAHVVAQSLDAAAVTAAAGGDALETLNDDATITVTSEGDSLFVNGAGILTPNIRIANGVIHVIDSVINTDGGEGEEDVIVPDQTQVAEGDPARDAALELIDNFNAVVDLGINATTLVPTTNLNFVTNQLAEYPEDDFFTEVGYKGAVDPSAATPWIAGWTLLDQGGYLTGSVTAVPAFAQSDIEGAASVLVTLPRRVVGDRTFSADSIYYIDGYSFVEDGELTIPAGTVIIAETTPSTGDPLSALIITRSATIQANGTADNPIIMTSENDFEGGPLDQNSTGEWGGLAILGEAPIANDGPEAQIEGIPTELPALYGGSTEDDNSGTITYVSIRYTGAAIEEGNELQGLSLGGVGSGTTIEYIESFASGDDGVEIFGGTANVKYFVAAFAEDDSYDFDNGWVGNGQFWLAVQDQQGTNGSLIEGDGTSPLTAELVSDPTIYNMTLIGVGAADQSILLRDRIAGTYANSIFVDTSGKGLQVENLDGDSDSYANLVNGDLQLLNNLWFLGADATQFNSTDTGIILATE